MRIPAITNLICGCWNKAEKCVSTLVRTRYLDKGEEFITELFHGELRAIVKEVSDAGDVRQAFLRDLEAAFPYVEYSQALDIAKGIRATTVLHPKEVETKTGGDLGILLIRPNVREDVYDDSVLSIDDDYQRGLLCQAKLKQRPTRSRRSVWGSLSPNQQKVLPQHLDYLTLILYQYLDAERMFLGPFQWQLCRGASVEEIKHWLRTDEFPCLQPSAEIIHHLGNDCESDGIGTDSKRIIQEYICPKVRPHLIIHIGWSPGGGPPSEVRIKKRTKNEHLVILQSA